jgi:hypothetical protein
LFKAVRSKGVQSVAVSVPQHISVDVYSNVVQVWATEFLIVQSKRKYSEGRLHHTVSKTWGATESRIQGEYVFVEMKVYPSVTRDVHTVYGAFWRDVFETFQVLNVQAEGDLLFDMKLWEVMTVQDCEKFLSAELEHILVTFEFKHAASQGLGVCPQSDPVRLLERCITLTFHGEQA